MSIQTVLTRCDEFVVLDASSAQKNKNKIQSMLTNRKKKKKEKSLIQKKKKKDLPHISFRTKERSTAPETQLTSLTAEAHHPPA